MVGQTNVPDPKVVSVKVPDSGSEEKRGPGRPKGSGSKKSDDFELDIFGIAVPALMQALAEFLVMRRGAHWKSFADGAEDFGELFAKYLNKRFPAVKLTKYAEEVALLMQAGKVMGPGLSVEFMMWMDRMNKPEVKQVAVQQERAGDARTGSKISEPSPVPPGDRQAGQPGQDNGVRDALPVLV